MNDLAHAAALVHPRRAARRRTAFFATLLSVGMAGLFVLELTVGAVHVPLRDAVAALTGHTPSTPVFGAIVQQFRLPRAVNAVASGAALGVCGLLLQTLFRNPLADPNVLGVVFGARLGVALLVVATGVAGNAFLYRFGLVGDMATAAASALGSTLVLVALLALARRVSTITLLVAGLMLGYLATGLVSVALHFVEETQAQSFQGWDDGSFAGATRQQLRLLLPAVCVGLLYAWTQAKALNALLLGEAYAESLGVGVRRIRWRAFLCLAILVGTVTAFCGPIAFIGLVTAHLSRLAFRTADHRVLLPASMAMGAALALAADLLTHLPWSRHVLHLNAVNGLIGAPIVLWALLDRRHARTLEV